VSAHNSAKQFDIEERRRRRGQRGRSSPGVITIAMNKKID
jgi:hypothetical protein